MAGAKDIINMMIESYTRGDTSIYSIVAMLKFFLILGELSQSDVDEFLLEIDYTDNNSFYELITILMSAIDDNFALDKDLIAKIVWLLTEFVGENHPDRLTTEQVNSINTTLSTL